MPIPEVACVGEVVKCPPDVGGVSSVYGRTGAVVAVAGDYAASQVSNDSAQPGATVADALNGLGSGLGGLAAALSALAATVPAWPDSSKAIATGGPLAPLGGTLANSGLFLAPPAPAARLTSAALQNYSPAVPIIQASVLTTIGPSGELLIGVGNGDPVNPATFALLTMASGPVTLP